MPDVPENNLPSNGVGYVTPPAEFDDGGCFEPFIPKVSVSPAPKPALKRMPPSLARFVDETLRGYGYVRTPTDTTPDKASQAPAAAESTNDAEMAPPSEILPASVKAPLPPPKLATAGELFTWIKRSISAQTHLPEDVAELVALWVISTWFQDALTVLPCMVITGPAHDAGSVLHVLSDFCCKAVLLAGFRRRDLGVLRGGYTTNLVSEPNLDKQAANFLGSLTDRRFQVVEGGR
jgi:hypothetical protein